MEDISINVLVDAKTEYTKQLTALLSPLLYEGFVSIFDEANDIKKTTQDLRYDDVCNLQIFQDLLRKIPKWNQDIIDGEKDRIILKSNCGWIEELLAAVFISNAKILSVIRLQNMEQKMKLKIPKISTFIHRCYIESAREFYKNIYLFDDDEITPLDKQKNIRDAIIIIRDSIQEAVRRLLPIQEIIKTYLGNVYNNEDDISVQSEPFMNDTLKKYADKKLRDSIYVSDDEKDDDNKEQFENIFEKHNDQTLSDKLIQQLSDDEENSYDKKNLSRDEVVEEADADADAND